MSRNVQLHIRVVGIRDANHVLIRVRHRFRTFANFPRSVCNAEFLQSILDLVLPLVDLVFVLELLCLLHNRINFGLRQLPFRLGWRLRRTCPGLTRSSAFSDSVTSTDVSLHQPRSLSRVFVNCSQCFHVFIISMSSIFLITCVFLIVCRETPVVVSTLDVEHLIHHSLAINFVPLISPSRTPATRQCTLSVSCLARHLFGLCT